MLSVDHARWGQTPEDLRRLAMSAPHWRTRERFLALHEIMQESSGATRVALRAGRHPQTVMGWLHAYNARGPDALVYRRTGGRPPFVPAPRPVSARSFATPSAPPPPRL
jgi:transposase